MTASSHHSFQTDESPGITIRAVGTRQWGIALRLGLPAATGPCSIEISLSTAAWRAVLDELVPAVDQLEPPVIQPEPEIKPAPDGERLLLPIWPDAAWALGIGRTKMFQLIGDGEVETVTIGRRVLIPADAIREYVQRLRSGNEK